MTKQAFLSKIAVGLDGLPQQDIDKTIDYYNEMIDDRIEDGMTEEEAVAAVGSAEEIVSQILSETSLPKLVKARVTPKRGLKAWEIVLLILGSPVWLPLLAAAVIVVLAVYLVIWSVIVVLYAADPVLAAYAILAPVGAVAYLFAGNSSAGMLFFGGALVCAGLSILWFFACNQVARGILYLSRAILRQIKAFFIGKGDL